VSGYAMFLVKVTDPGWVEPYMGRVEALVASHGGRYLARGPGTRIEGELDTDVVVIIEFPSTEAAQAFHDDPAYADILQQRLAGSVSHGWVVDGV
jgi:uncharacterized protein (DUF1330 family)